MKELFRNNSPSALTRKQAAGLHKKRVAERSRQAQELAAQGRGGDTEIAHVSLGELVVPVALQNPEVLAALRRAAASQNIPFDRLRVGNRANRINPHTGAAEFDVAPDLGSYRYNPDGQVDGALGEPLGQQGYDARSPPAGNITIVIPPVIPEIIVNAPRVQRPDPVVFPNNLGGIESLGGSGVPKVVPGQPHVVPGPPTEEVVVRARGTQPGKPIPMPANRLPTNPAYVNAFFDRYYKPITDLANEMTVSPNLLSALALNETAGREQNETMYSG